MKPALPVLLLILAVLAGRAQGETSTHERLGVMEAKPWDLSWGLDLEAWPRPGGGLGANLGLGLGLALSSLFSFSLSLPVDFSLGDGAEVATILPPQASLSLGLRKGPWRLSLGMAGRLPSFGGGEERRTLLGRVDLSLQALRYLDPLLLGVAMGGGSLVPGSRGYQGEDMPLGLSLRLWATEALNERVSATLEAKQALALPPLGTARPRDWAWGLSLSCVILVLFRDGGLSLGLDDLASPHFLASAYGDIMVGGRREKKKD
jgi:hypothetical protein